jgi:SNF2-related domain
MESPLYEQLKLINNVYSHSIEEKQYGLINSIVPAVHMNNIPHLKTSLMPHQLRTVLSMILHLYQMNNGIIVEDQHLSGKLGIIADSPGSGKTLSILAYLSVLNKAATYSQIQAALGITVPYVYRGELNTNSNRFFSSHQLIQYSDLSSVNVVVVPPHLLQHWQNEILTHTTLQPFIIDKPRILRNRTTIDGVLNSPFILTTSRFMKEVYEWSSQNQIQWNNVFLDEATSIILQAVPKFKFLWLITNQWLSLMFRNQYIFPHNLHHIRDRIQLHPDCDSWLTDVFTKDIQITTNIDSSPFYRNLIPWTHSCRYSMILRNRNTISYPSIQETVFECAASYTLANLPQSIIGNHYAGLTHDKIPKLFKSLGLNEYTQEMVLAHHMDKKELIEGKWNDDCSICLEPTQNKTLLPCCMNMFCGACILRQILTQTQSLCPICRTPLYLPSLLPIAEWCSRSQFDDETGTGDCVFN